MSDGEGGDRPGAEGRDDADDGRDPDRRPQDEHADAGGPGAGGDGDAGDCPVDDPFSDLETPEGDVGDLFTGVEATDVDTEAVWADLEGTGAEDGADVAGFSDEPSGVTVPGDPDGGDGAIVAKASYCQRCEHFSAPPDVGCTNPGTEIVELADVDHFRVRECPVVERRQGASVSELGQDDGDGREPGEVDGPGVDDRARAGERVGSDAGSDAGPGDGTERSGDGENRSSRGGDAGGPDGGREETR